MRSIDILRKPPVFGLIAPIDSKRSVRISNTALSLSAIFSIACILYGTIVYIGASRNEAGELVGHPALGIPTITTGLILGFVTLWYAWTRSKSQFDDQHPNIGFIQISTRGLRIHIKGLKELLVPFESMHRMDLYYYAGVAPIFFGKKGGHQNVASLRMRLRVGSKVMTFYVKNGKNSDKVYGSFYECIRLLRRDNETLHHKIQIWDKF